MFIAHSSCPKCLLKPQIGATYASYFSDASEPSSASKTYLVIICSTCRPSGAKGRCFSRATGLGNGNPLRTNSFAAHFNFRAYLGSECSSGALGSCVGFYICRLVARYPSWGEVSSPIREPIGDFRTNVQMSPLWGFRVFGVCRFL